LRPINSCIFPVAGYGSRFFPVTKSIPKEMLPVLNYPIIHYAVKEAIDSGVENLEFITSSFKQSIKDYFEINHSLVSEFSDHLKREMLEKPQKLITGKQFNFINQDEMLGLGHAILLAERHIKEDAFSVILPDDLCRSEKMSVLQQMINIHKEFIDFCIVAVEEVPKSLIHNYGIVATSNSLDAKLFLVDDMIEKPSIEFAPSNLAAIGRYILTSDIFDILKHVEKDKSGEIQITEALKVKARQGKLLAYKFDGERYDCGSVAGYVKANSYFLKDLSLSM